MIQTPCISVFGTKNGVYLSIKIGPNQKFKVLLRNSGTLRNQDGSFVLQKGPFKREKD